MLEDEMKKLKDEPASEELYETLIAIKVVAGRMAEKVREKLIEESIRKELLDQ